MAVLNESGKREGETLGQAPNRKRQRRMALRPNTAQFAQLEDLQLRLAMERVNTEPSPATSDDTICSNPVEGESEREPSQLLSGTQVQGPVLLIDQGKSGNQRSRAAPASITTPGAEVEAEAEADAEAETGE